jgi:DNA-binding transcriptional MerR regulator
MQINTLAEAAKVPATTIRYYEAIGLLPQPRRLANGYRDYAEPASATMSIELSAIIERTDRRRAHAWLFTGRHCRNPGAAGQA